VLLLLHYTVIFVDAEVSRKMLTMLLKRKNVNCHMAEDGQQALDMVLPNIHAYKLILMDNLMPNVDGIEATKVLRKSGFQYFIVGLTGNVMSEDVEEFLHAGADLVLAKPLEMNKLDMLLSHISDHGYSSKQRERKCLVEDGNRFVWKSFS